MSSGHGGTHFTPPLFQLGAKLSMNCKGLVGAGRHAVRWGVPRPKCHLHSVLRAQRDKRVRFDCETGLSAELKIAEEENCHDRQFLQSEVAADATARASAEREINHCLRGRTARRCKARRIKFLRLRPEALVPMEMK